jgi:hypothetical protein
MKEDFFNSDYIIAYSEVNEELKELIELSGYKEEFTRKFRKTLIMLERFKEKLY